MSLLRRPQLPLRGAHAARILLPLLSVPVASAFSPSLEQIQPRGGQRGTEIEVQLDGERLDGLREALFYQPGLTLSGITVKDGKHAVAKLAIAPDAPLGEHALRLRSPGGITGLRTFWVGAFPSVNEEEPNNSFDKPQRIERNTTVHGTSGNEDEDYYVCSLKKGDRLSVEIEAMRLGRTMFDPYLAILGPDRFELASCDDAPLLRNDAFAGIIAPADGDYRILVREAAYEGSDQCQYRLHIGDFPRPSAVFPPGGKPGETLAFRFIGDPRGEIRQQSTLPATTGMQPLFAIQDGVSSPSANPVQVSPLEHAEEQEPNNNAKEATALPPLPCAGQGILSEPDDNDWFRFTAKKDENLVLRVLGRALRSPVDPLLKLRDGSGKQLAENDDQGGPDPVIQWTCPADGEYFAQVRDQLKRSGPDFTYRLEIVRKEPSIAATLPVVERVNSQKWKTFPVPRGNRYAAVINVTRENIAADLAFRADSLPSGVKLDAPPVPRSITSFPVVFEAAADAPVAGSFHTFTLASTGDGPKLLGKLTDTIHLVDINNQGAYHSVPLDRIAMAVTEEAPFRIELDPPKIPLCRNGVLALKVRLDRKPGDQEPVTVRFLWSPPGIGAPVTIQIPGDQSEAAYEINANGDAATGEWKICVLAEANTPRGPVLVSSSLVPLRIEEPCLAMTLEMAATEPGKPVPMPVKIEHHRAFEGHATAELIGLPNGVTAPPVTFTKDQQEATFQLAVTPDAPVGKHQNVFCKVSVPSDGGVILQNTGQGGTLRIDKPSSPPAVAQGTPQPAPAAAPSGTPGKPLSRLEQLRQSKP